MSIYFTDSSAVVKRYLRETGSGRVRGLFVSTPPNEFYAVATVGVEVVAAVTRRVRGGTGVISVSDTLLREAIRLAQLYGLRGYDAIQLAAANQISRLRVTTATTPLIFVSADKELNAAASGEGLAVADPNAHL